MNRVVEKLQQAQVRKDLPEFRPGDTVRVHVRLKEVEGEKERIQPFEGVVISKRGRLAGASFTVLVNQGRVRRAKLYYLRGRKGKAARIKRAARIELPATPPEVPTPE